MLFSSLSRLLPLHSFRVLVLCLLSLTSRGLANPENTILFYGNSMVERLLENGELEARLQIVKPDAQLKIRSLAWTGDEVGHRLRLEGYAKHMRNLLDEWPAQTIVLGYGMNESFAGPKGLPAFRAQYNDHLKQLNRLHPQAKFFLLSPIAVENASPERQGEVETYSQEIKKLAEQHKAQFIDLFQPTQSTAANEKTPLTHNGIHLNDFGTSLVAKTIAKAIAGNSAAQVDSKHLKEVAHAASAKHARVAEIVRPKNGVVYFGVRARSYEYEREMPRYHQMIAETEKVVHRLAADSSLTYAKVPKPKLPPLPKGKGKDDGDRTGIIKSPAEAMAEFTVAEDFEVNLFASEEQFPELRNPVQIAFDARGRLWVVTMPSFPHTVPGLTPPDKIIILEDTDKDGRADKLTTFMEGLDALDGVAFHRDGVIISEQPRLWLVKDTDGDDRADTKEELLRGIDVTDSHHGGMIAADPYGDIIFSDGVFHRSQLETPYGVHRGIDATTYRLDTNNGRIVTEWQHVTPNPWKVTHNRWGEIMQMYGDGHVYDGSCLIWGPLGAYHPFRFGKIADYGKGSGVTVISGTHFPKKYQQGTASASLLGRYTVNITAYEISSGIQKRTKNITILQSPNAAFRPADVEFGSDGALYISDFCSPIIGHAQHPMRDPHWDHDYGRIWRVTYKKNKLQSDWPQILDASLSELCPLLLHPSDLARHHTRIELRKNGPPALKALDKWFTSLDSSKPNYNQAALEILFVADGLEQTRPALIKQLLNSGSERYIAAALRTIRLQAGHLLDNPVELLALAKDNTHPRVQIELIDAVAHLRPVHPQVETVLLNLKPANKQVQGALDFLAKGTKPLKGRSVPVLDVDKKSNLIEWLWAAKKGDPYQLLDAKEKRPNSGIFRSFVKAESEAPATIALKHKNLEVFLNESLVFSQDSFWSGDQQINVTLKKGVNVIDIHLKASRRTKALPSVFLYDPVGQALKGVTYPSKSSFVEKSQKDFQITLDQRGETLRVQAAPELQFSPKELRVKAGAEINLIFENPDPMQHNWVLLDSGTFDTVGALADKLAGQPDGLEKQYLPDTPHILAASKLLAPNESQNLTFKAPSKPGRYPYVCTFPGHWRVMRGELIVE